MEEYDRKKQRAKAELGKDIADALFRVFQIFFVWVVLSYLWGETQHWLAMAASFVLSAVLMLHLFNAPAAALFKFEESYGETRAWFQYVSWIGLIASAALILTFMTQSDQVIATINDLMHPPIGMTQNSR